VAYNGIDLQRYVTPDAVAINAARRQLLSADE
jgi:hypothetical protein